jgi:hypothetical protein
MAQTRTITLKKDESFVATQMISSYIGKKTLSESGVPLYDIIKAISQDKDFVSDKVDDFEITLSEICREYIIGSVIKGQIVLSMPDEFTDELYAQFVKAIDECLCSYLFARWLEYTSSTEAKSYFDQYSSLLQSLQKLLYVRTIPTPPQKA